MYINEESREQIHLFEEKLDDIISKDNPARFIDAYIEKIDLKKLGFIISGESNTGRPAYRPSTLLKIYIYGYLNRIRSSRKLEAECMRNVELMWLTGRVTPDFKTIADFRGYNKIGLKNIFREFLRLCHKLELVSLKYVAIDGTKKRAQNGLDNIYKRESIDSIEKQINERIDQYIAELDRLDKEEENEYEFLSRNLPEKISQLKKKKDKVEIIKKIFQTNPELEIFFANDPDSRYMKDNNRVNAGYNCQTAVDEKNNLIVANDVVNESNDLHQLNNMIDQVRETKEDLGEDGRTITAADAGYFQEEEIVKASNLDDFDVYVSHPRDTGEKNKKKKNDKIPAKGYTRDNFKYDIENDHFTCPEGKILMRSGNGYVNKKTGGKKYQYVCKEYKGCSNRNLCTNDKRGRTVKATEHIKEIMAFRDKCNSESGKLAIKKRKETVEHPFGTLKGNWGYRYFMQRGLETVQAEFSFITFIYNFRRVLNLVSIDHFIKQLEAVRS
jgi:transposase